MKIDRIQISVAELCQGYEERGTDGIEGIVAYGGLLDVRPPYQREYVYAPKERDEVIRTVKKGFPLNTMYWAKIDDGRYELMDGQQRTISICRYAAESERTFAVDEKYYFNLEKDLQKQIDDYVLDIYVCDGTPSEVHEWFKVINITADSSGASQYRLYRHLAFRCETAFFKAYLCRLQYGEELCVGFPYQTGIPRNRYQVDRCP